MKKGISLLAVVVVALALAGCSTSEATQKVAEEYAVYLAENGGYVAPTSIKVIKAAYSTLDTDIYECEGYFLFTIEAKTRGGGADTGDVMMVRGGIYDKMFYNEDDLYYSEQYLNLDVGKINKAIQKHWQKLGISE